MLFRVELPENDASRSTIVISFEMSNVNVNWRSEERRVGKEC